MPQTENKETIDIKTIYTNPEDPRSIQTTDHGTSWSTFISGLSQSIQNTELHDFPYARLNDDRSISFFLHTCNTTACTECKKNQEFKDTFSTAHIIDQIDYLRKERGFATLGPSKELLAVNKDSEKYGVVEYKLNISPENLDSILKESPRYAYRNTDGTSVLKLCKKCSLKPGVIRLFPVFALNEDQHFLRAAGCQIIEMTTIQLLHLLPSFDGVEKPFHWVPHELSEKIHLNSADYERILTDILVEQKMVPEGLFLQSSDGQNVVLDKGLGKVKIAAMDPESRDFYQTYGNCTKEELDNCKSAEISTVAFLEALEQLVLNKSQKAMTDPYYIDNPHLITKMLNGLENIMELIQLEKYRMLSLVATPQTLFATSSTSPEVKTPLTSTSTPKPGIK